MTFLPWTQSGEVTERQRYRMGPPIRIPDQLKIRVRLLHVHRDKVFIGLTFDDDAWLPTSDENHCWTQHLVVVGTHRVTVRTRHGRAQHVADRQRCRNRSIAHDDVPRLAVLPHDMGAVRPWCVCIDRSECFVAAAIEHGPGIVRHSPIDRDVGSNSGDLLDRSHCVGRHSGCRNDGTAWFSCDLGLYPRQTNRIGDG
jgi:hypothetical protein